MRKLIYYVLWPILVAVALCLSFMVQVAVAVINAVVPKGEER